MSVPFDWNKYDTDVKTRILERSKSGAISYIKDIDELTTWKIYHAHWEDWLSSSLYFKDWQEKINSFQTKKEVDFYMSRLRAFIEFVWEHTRKNILHVENAKPWDPETTPKLIEQELKRLENISEEEFNKIDKWEKSVEFKELSVEEMKNDPWFSKQLGFDSENEKNEEKGKVDYKSWTRNQLISEINRLKTEDEQLKNNQTLTSSERQERLQKNQKKLEQLEGFVEVNNSSAQQPINSNSLTPLLIGGITLLILGVVVGLLISKRTKKVRNKQQN